MKALFLSVTVGAGHNSVAKALNDYFSLQGFETQTIDLFKNCKKIQSAISGVGFKAMYTFPKIANMFYNKDKRTNHSFFEIAIKYTKDETLKKINEFSPDIIVSSHIAGLVFTQKYRNLINKPFKNAFIVTDYDLTPSLFNDNNQDFIIVPNKDFKQQLLNKGFAEDKVYPFGIPISAKFFQKQDKQSLVEKLNLSNFDTTKPTILFMGGGKGLGKIYGTIKYLIKNSDLQCIVICGKNQKLKQKIDSIKSNKVFSFGYVNNVNELMDLSDYIFGKTGGLSSTESLAKNLVILSYKNIPCPEYANLMYFAKNNVAFVIKKQSEIISNTKANKKNTDTRFIKPNTCKDIYELLTNKKISV